MKYVVHRGDGRVLGEQLGELILSPSACDGGAREACRALEATFGVSGCYSPDGDVGCCFFACASGEAFFLVWEA